MPDLEVCPFCKADLYHHCNPPHAGCPWLECRSDKGGCGALLDPKGKRAVRNHTPVPWRYVEPERGSE